MMEKDEPLCFTPNAKEYRDDTPERCASLAIGVFEDDEGSLCFPQEEGQKVEEIQL